MKKLPENADLLQITAKVNEIIRFFNSPFEPDSEPEESIDAIDSTADNPEPIEVQNEEGETNAEEQK